MDFKKLLIANAYLIGAILIIFGFIWMGALAVVESDFEQVLIAFSITIVGIGFWSAAVQYNNKKRKKLLQKMHSPTTHINPHLSHS